MRWFYKKLNAVVLFSERRKKLHVLSKRAGYRFLQQSTIQKRLGQKVDILLLVVIVFRSNAKMLLIEGNSRNGFV